MINTVVVQLRAALAVAENEASRIKAALEALGETKTRKKRVISPEGMARIKAAQAKRWAKVRRLAKVTPIRPRRKTA